MASVELSRTEVQAQLAAAGVDDVVVAVVSSPASTVVAGDTARVHELVAGWQARDVTARPVAVDVASHSPQVDPILDELLAALADLNPGCPAVPFYTTVLDDPNQPPAFDRGYWVANLRRPVRFADAVSAALADGHRLFVEVSPHPVLTHAIDTTAAASQRDVVVLATLRRGEDERLTLLTQLAALHSAGAPVDWRSGYPHGALIDVPLPVWDQRHLMIDSGAAYGRHTVVAHPLLGVHTQVPDADGTHVWQADAGTAALPWMLDHLVHGLPVLPGAGYCEMALTAAGQVFATAPSAVPGVAGVEVGEVTFHDMLFLSEHTTVSATATPDGPGRARFEVFTKPRDGNDGGAWTRHVTATLRRSDAPAPPRMDVAELLARHPEDGDTAELYRAMGEQGVLQGPAFAGLDALHAAGGHAATVLGRVRIPSAVRAGAAAFVVHPVLLDTCFQTLVSHPAIRGRLAGLALPLGARTIRAFGDPNQGRYCLALLHHVDDASVLADLRLLAEDGTVLVEIDGFRLGGGVEAAQRRFADRLHTIGWEETGHRDIPGEDIPGEPAGSWLVLSERDGRDGLPTALAAMLGERGGRCELLESPLDSGGDPTAFDAAVARPGLRGVVVVCPPAGEVGEAGLDRARLRVGRLIELVRSLADNTGGSPGLWVVTRDAQPVLDGDGLAVEQAGLRGLCRVIAYEHPELRTRYVDLDAAAGAVELAVEVLSGVTEDEIAWRDGQRYVARLRNTPLRDDERKTRTVHFGQHEWALRVRQPGDLASLELVATHRRRPGPGEIEVHVHAAGVTDTDVLDASAGEQTTDAQPVALGLACAGVVGAVGTGVTGFRSGDRVAAVQSGTFRSSVTVDVGAVMRIPDDMAMTAAAALPAAYVTAWYGLRHLARLRAGERVLIHPATDGVALAAIAIARSVGAEVFATAGSERERAHLRAIGVSHVMDSPTLPFADQIRQIAGGDGVDVVLTCRPGRTRRAGLDLLRTGGRFVELGARDSHAGTAIGRYPLPRGITLSSLDLRLIAQEQPAVLASVVREIADELAAGRLQPLPHTVHQLTEASTALQAAAGGEHIGTVVLAMPQRGAAQAVIPPSEVPVVRSDGAYVVTGGLGGLGLVVARWLAESGAGRIVLNGRSTPSPYAAQVLEALRGAGADIEVVLGDIAAAGTADRAVVSATATGLALRGIVHSSVVLNDTVIALTSDQALEEVWRPKAVGAWRLHRASTGHELDWWLAFSSAVALVGNPGQGAYAAANGWLDGFVTWRRSQGLPAISIGWGAWSQVGRGAFYERDGYQMITPQEGITACERLLRYDRPRTGYLPIKGSNWLDNLTGVRQSSFFQPVLTGVAADASSAAADETVLMQLHAVEPAARRSALEDYLIDQVSSILRFDRTTIHPDRPLTEVGLDSLRALELRSPLPRHA
ncbi:MAG: hypothetical protein AUI14_01945 [Actinobacteria bacterium 13_2_20CM_2_71_6]|nr:MAG: hypothetical protein AUI14_01945 [Actinobacteria bacterium 13_2_20CM_2_71_6]